MGVLPVHVAATQRISSASNCRRFFTARAAGNSRVHRSMNWPRRPSPDATSSYSISMVAKSPAHPCGLENARSMKTEHQVRKCLAKHVPTDRDVEVSITLDVFLETAFERVTR